MKFNYKIINFLYLLVLTTILIITIKHHRKKENIVEHFQVDSKLLRSKNRREYSDCKYKCMNKYSDDEHVKVCKSICKCKKNCESSDETKSCKKECNKMKVNIYRDNPHKMEKQNIKKDIKEIMKENKKNKKFEKKNIIDALEKKESYKKNMYIYRDTVQDKIDKYLTDKDKARILKTNKDIKDFTRDFKKVIRLIK